VPRRGAATWATKPSQSDCHAAFKPLIFSLGTVITRYDTDQSAKPGDWFCTKAAFDEADDCRSFELEAGSPRNPA
jgi:hypothetical protein